MQKSKSLLPDRHHCITPGSLQAYDTVQWPTRYLDNLINISKLGSMHVAYIQSKRQNADDTGNKCTWIYLFDMLHLESHTFL